MNRITSLEHLAEHLTQHSRYQEKTGTASPPPTFTIALSREAGAKGAVVAREIGQRLGWEVYDRELVEKIAGEMGLRTRLLESVDERRQGWLEECLGSFLSGERISSSAYVHHLAETLLSLAAKGNCVIVGRGATELLRSATTLRVRLIGGREDRVRTMQEGRGLSHEEAARWVDDTDRERVQFVEETFRKDPRDPQHYDLVINSSRFSVSECTDLIIEALHRLQTQTPTDKRLAPAAC